MFFFSFKIVRAAVAIGAERMSPASTSQVGLDGAAEVKNPYISGGEMTVV